MKQIFFKTVRENYQSLYARGRLSRKYKIGKRYRFTERFPAHVFTMQGICMDSLNSDMVYDHRKEADGGNRVLICYGEVKTRIVPCMEIGAPVWDFKNNRINTAERETSIDFVVIGEIALPSRYFGVRPTEEENRDYHRLADKANSVRNLNYDFSANLID